MRVARPARWRLAQVKPLPSGRGQSGRSIQCARANAGDRGKPPPTLVGRGPRWSEAGACRKAPIPPVGSGLWGVGPCPFNAAGVGSSRPGDGVGSVLSTGAGVRGKSPAAKSSTMRGAKALASEPVRRRCRTGKSRGRGVPRASAFVGGNRGESPPRKRCRDREVRAYGCGLRRNSCYRRDRAGGGHREPGNRCRGRGGTRCLAWSARWFKFGSGGVSCK